MSKEELERRVSTGVADKVESLLAYHGVDLFDPRTLARWLVDKRKGAAS